MVPYADRVDSDGNTVQLCDQHVVICLQRRKNNNKITKSVPSVVLATQKVSRRVEICLTFLELPEGLYPFLLRHEHVTLRDSGVLFSFFSRYLLLSPFLLALTQVPEKQASNFVNSDFSPFNKRMSNVSYFGTVPNVCGRASPLPFPLWMTC